MKQNDCSCVLCVNNSTEKGLNVETDILSILYDEYKHNTQYENKDGKTWFSSKICLQCSIKILEYIFENFNDEYFNIKARLIIS